MEEIFKSARFLVATHNNFIGPFFGRNHQHPDFYQVSYVLKGQERVFVGNRHYMAKEGDLFFIPPRCTHGSGLNDKKKRFELLQIKFSLPRCQSLPFPAYIRIGSPTDLLAAFYSIFNEFHMERPQRDRMMRINLAHLVLLAHRCSLLKGIGCHLPSLKDAKLAEERMGKVIQYIQLNFSRELTLPEIAKANGCSVSALSHVFKRYVGVSPVKYLINYRLSMALDLLRRTDRKLDDIALETGFSNAYYFSRLFRKRYNQSPRRYARLVYNSSLK